MVGGVAVETVNDWILCGLKQRKACGVGAVGVLEERKASGRWCGGNSGEGAEGRWWAVRERCGWGRSAGAVRAGAVGAVWAHWGGVGTVAGGGEGTVRRAWGWGCGWWAVSAVFGG